MHSRVLFLFSIALAAACGGSAPSADPVLQSAALQGYVYEVDGQTVDRSGVLGVREQPHLKMGTFVRAEIRGRRANDVVILPRAVLQPDDTVLIANADRELEVRTVTVARAEPREVYISAGIADGELVVTTPLEAPIPGTQLAIRGEPVADEAQGAAANESESQ